VRKAEDHFEDILRSIAGREQEARLIVPGKKTE
jgi:hypothetical protein